MVNEPWFPMSSRRFSLKPTPDAEWLGKTMLRRWHPQKTWTKNSFRNCFITLMTHDGFMTVNGDFAWVSRESKGYVPIFRNASDPTNWAEDQGKHGFRSRRSEAFTSYRDRVKLITWVWWKNHTKKIGPHETWIAWQTTKLLLIHEPYPHAHTFKKGLCHS